MNETTKLSQILRESALVVGDSLNLNAVLDTVLTAVREVVSYDAASIMLLDEDILSVVRSVSDTPLQGWVFPVNEVPHFKQIIEQKQPIFIGSVKDDPDWVDLNGTKWVQSYIGLPIITKDEVHGILNVDGRLPNQFMRRDVDILQVFAAQVGLAIRNATLFQNLQSMTITLEQTVNERTQHLSDLRQRVETILNHASDAIILTDERLGILQANFAFEQLFGYETDEQFRQLVHSLIAPSELQLFNQLIDEIDKRREISRVEIVALRKDKTNFHAEISLAPIESKTMPGYVCTIRDISESKQMFSALQVSEARARAMLDTALDCIISIDSQGNFIEFNSAAEQTFGYSREEVIGKPMSNMIMPTSYQDAHHHGMQRFLDSNESKVLNQRIELPAQRADGSEFPMEITIVPVETDEMLFFTAYLRDITERKLAEQALKDSESKFKSVFESSNDGIILHNFNGDILDMNQRILEMLQYEYDAITSLKLPNLHPESEHPITIAAQETVQTEGAVQFRITFLRSDGSLFPAEVSASITEIDGQQIIQGIIRDVTEREKIENDLRASLTKEREVGELKSRFVSMASHELRTPLATISSTNELLQEYFDEMLPDERQERFDRIENQVQHMTNLLEGVLTIGKIDSDTYIFRPRQLDVGDLASEVMEDVLLSFHHSHLIDFNVCGNDLMVNIDAQLIRQALINLLSNAIKYSSRGSRIRFEVNVNDSELELLVADSGIGIPQEDQAQLFQRFHRGTNTTGISGTGLGLSIVKYAVDLHGGTISFQSEVSKGTSFYLKLPKTVEV